MLTEEKRLSYCPIDGGTTPWAWILNGIGDSKLYADIHPCLHPGGGPDVTSLLKLMLPLLPHSDGQKPQTVIQDKPFPP